MRYFLEQKEVDALKVLIDGGVRHLGLQAAESAAVLLRKLNQGVPDEPVDTEPGKDTA